jgi:hypothetical protein
VIRLRTILFVCIGCAIACSVAPVKKPDTIIFSHHLHSEQGVDCQDCHAAVLDPKETGRAIPAEAQCADCHDVEEQESCATCHRNPDTASAAKTAQDSHLLFSHVTHTETHGVECNDCHKGAAHWPDFYLKKQQPLGHADCVSCHKPDLDSGRCGKCHQRLDLYAAKPENMYSHGDGFFSRHGFEAQGAEDICAQCHDQYFCTDCHDKTMTVRPSVRYPERVDRTLIHRGDWIGRHNLEARLGDTGCMKCHGESFCSACHERIGIGPAPIEGVAKTSPHGDSSTWVNSRGADGHGQAARRRIQECASCHDQGPSSNCVRCHTSGRINPHPPGWDPPVNRDRRASNKMCSICHNN